jgi:hypothetical protein
VADVKRARQGGYWEKWSIFHCLAITTAVSAVLLIAETRGWVISGSAYDTVIGNRATVQSAIQLIASLLGLIHTSIVARLVHNGARLRFSRRSPFSMGSLRGWTNMGITRVQWDIPLRYLVPVLAISSLGVVSSALWVGAMTPVVGSTVVAQSLLVPSFSNTSLIKEYPSEVKQSGPTLVTPNGLFSYSVGIKHLGSLIASAASATTGDGSVRKHAKLDTTQFIYKGRSYGVGSPVGLLDSNITSLPLATAYDYLEAGYESHVECMYNSSTQFIISNVGSQRTFPAVGLLPDSDGGPEYSEYFGHNADTIVAVGVAFSGESPRRYLAIAAGSNYGALNATQCTVDFTPTLFNVSASLAGRNISVTPVREIDDFDPQRNMTRTLMRQFELIANDLTNVYESILGDALLSSVASWNASFNPQGNITEGDATLEGVRNAVIAMADDMLAAYAAAQLMVGNFTTPTAADVLVSSLGIGQWPYILSISLLNVLIILAFVVEVVRTRSWQGLPALDFSNPSWVITASYRGGVLSQQAEGFLGGSTALRAATKRGDMPSRRGQEKEMLVELRDSEEGELALLLVDTCET